MFLLLQVTLQRVWTVWAILKSFFSPTTHSYAACCKFIENNKLLSIIRGHEVQDAGFKMYRKRSSTGFPALMTVFSAPNYCDYYKNKVRLIEAIYSSGGMGRLVLFRDFWGICCPL